MNIATQTRGACDVQEKFLFSRTMRATVHTALLLGQVLWRSFQRGRLLGCRFCREDSKTSKSTSTHQTQDKMWERGRVRLTVPMALSITKPFRHSKPFHSHLQNHLNFMQNGAYQSNSALTSELPEPDHSLQNKTKNRKSSKESATCASCNNRSRETNLA